MPISLLTRLRARFARDTHAFWWNHLTDQERELREMDALELSAALHEAQVHNNFERKILVEHMLGARLAGVQAKAAWGSGVLGFFGAVLGAGITVAMTAALTPPPEPKITVTCDYPVSTARSQPSSTAKAQPGTALIPVPASSTSISQPSSKR